MIVIEDDGVGFVAAGGSGSPGARGYGLDFMRERMAEIGGTLTLESAPDSGTRVLLAAPCSAAPPRAAAIPTRPLPVEVGT